jgi:NADPH:quinone reductase-like Zn-dependent oxidoreductase
MKTMKVMRFNDSTNAPALVAATVLVPQPRPGEILARVQAAGVTPTELQWYPTTHTSDGGKRTGAIPGHEFSGIVEAVGRDVDPGLVGHEVFGLNDWFADGATAEYCVAQASGIAPKPNHLSHAEAASVPIGALTAWQGLFDRARLRAGERVLIHGASGSVGIFAVQLARRAGASVIATASARNAEFLRQLGAERVIDYHSGSFEEHVSDMDVVFDGVGGTTLERSWNVLKRAGRMVTIAAASEGAHDERTKAAFFIVEPNQQELSEIARLLDRGELKTCVDGVVPLAQASAVYFGIGGRRLGRGKVVITLVEEPRG